MSKMKLQMVIQAVDKLTSPMRAMGKAVGDMGRKAEKSLGDTAHDAARSRKGLVSLTAPVAKLGKSLSRVAQMSSLGAVSKQAKGVRSNLTRLVAPLGRVSRKLKQLGQDAKLDKVAADLGNLGGALKSVGAKASIMGAGVAGAFWGMDAVSKGVAEQTALAQSVGVSSKALSAWAGMAKGMGFEADNVADLVEEMNNKIGESKGLGEVTTPVKEGLQMLGLEFDKIANMNPEEQFRAIAEAAISQKDAQVAASAMDMISGGEGNKLISLWRVMSKESGKAFQDLEAEYRKLNLQTDAGRSGNVEWANTSKKLFTMLGSGVQEIAGIIGSHLIPVAKEFMGWLVDNFEGIRNATKDFAGSLPKDFDELKDSFKSLWEGTAGFRKFLVNIVKLVGPFNLLLGAAAAMIGGPLVVAISTLATAFISLGTAIGFTPLGWLLGAIAALVAGAVLLVTYWEEVVAFFASFSDSIKEAFEGVTTYFTTLWEGIKQAFNDGLINGVVHLLSTFNPVNMIARAVNAVVKYLFGVDLFSIGQEWMSGLWDGLLAVWGNISAWLSEAVSELVDVLPDWIKDKIGIGSGSGEAKGDAASQTALPENGKAQVGGTVRVAFENAPASMRVRDVKNEGSGVGLDVDAGYNMMTP